MWFPANEILLEMKYFLRRAIAYFVDCLCCYGVIMLVLQWAILSNLQPLLGIDEEWFQISLNVQLYVLLTISIPVWAYFTYFDSRESKGTIGKRLLKLSVVDDQQQRLDLYRSFQRTFLKLLPWEVAHLGVIWPEPIYFADEPNVRIFTIVGIILLAVYTFSVVLSTQQQSVYDKWLDTAVLTE